MKEELEAGGVDNVELWFMQIGIHQKTPAQIEEQLGDFPTTVLADDPEGTLFTAFASSWYEAVLLDPEDCIVAKFGPFSGDPDSREILPIWEGAATGTLPCDEPVEPGAEVVEEL